MYRNYGLYLLKHFVVALTNVCTEAGAAALIETIEIGGGDGTLCRGKNAPKLGEIFFYFV